MKDLCLFYEGVLTPCSVLLAGCALRHGKKKARLLSVIYIVLFLEGS